MKFVAISTVLIAATTLATTAFAHGPGFGRLDANQDGKITKEEARAGAAAFFARLDTNQDGVITKAESEAAHKARGADFEKRGEERFAQRDTNKNGKLERSEISRMPEERFKALDTNKDGALSKDELKAGFAAKAGQRGGKGPHAGKHDPFAAADTNKDGKVTKAEAQSQADAHFQKMDKNGDGVISQDELPRRGQRGAHEKGEKKGACGPQKKASSRPA